MKNVGLPVFAKGVTPVGPLHRGPGEINYPVSCGGIVVNAGDIICADLTGVVVVREEFAEDLLHRLDAHLERTKKYVDAVRRGEFSNQWVDDALAAHDCMVKYE
jgi:regulator of RNase E activity RraA